MDGLLSALASKDRAKLRAFVVEHFRSPLSADDWVSRLWPIVEDLAPLRVVERLETNESRQTVIAEDSRGQRWALRIELVDHPPKISSVLITDPGSLDAPPPKDYSGWKDLAGLVKALREDSQSPAIGVAVWREGHGLEVVADGVRVHDKEERVTPSDIWHYGSIAKSITCTMIAHLIEKGTLRWDTTLKEALPGIPMKSDYKDVTLFQLMRHRAGVPRDMVFTARQVRQICGSETDPVKIRALYARDILGREPLAKPDARFAYSNAGYALLGHVAEFVTGKPYERLLSELVFEPLGMKSAIVGTQPLPPNRPLGHVLGQGGLRVSLPDAQLAAMMAPAGEVLCSLLDLIAYARAHLNGLNGKGGLLRPETVRKLHEATTDPGGMAYACGWRVGPLAGAAKSHSHNGSNMTFYAELAIFPEAGLIVAAVVNRGVITDPNPALNAVLAVARRHAPSE